MKADKSYGRIALWMAFLMVGLWGCAGKPFNPQEPGEIPEGPGIFTKEDGVVVLYDSKKRKAESAVERATPSELPADETNPASNATFEEYEAFKKWLEWKKSSKEHPEYEEFKQWREWRQYQQWKKRQQ